MDMDIIDLSSDDEQVLGDTYEDEGDAGASATAAVKMEVADELDEKAKLKAQVMAYLTSDLFNVHFEQDNQYKFDKYKEDYEHDISIMAHDIKVIGTDIEEVTKHQEYVRKKIEIYGRPLEMCETLLSDEVTWNNGTRSLDVPDPHQRVVPISGHTILAPKEPTFQTQSKQEMGLFGSDSDEDVVPVASVIQMTTTSKFTLKVGRPTDLVLKVDLQVYAPMDWAVPTALWKLATVRKIFSDGNITVRFSNSDLELTMHSKYLVSIKPQQVLLNIGQRVVAHFKPEPDADRKSCPLHAGHIAEVAVPANRHRYLIFFDNGKVSYCTADEVFALTKYTKDMAIEMIRKTSDDYGQFLETYFKDYPERMMLRPERKTSLEVLHDGMWVKGFVRLVDCSLIRIKLKWKESGDDKKFQRATEWLFRGSIRLKAIFEKFFPDKVDLGHLGPRRVRKWRPLRNFDTYKKKPVVQYTRQVLSEDEENTWEEPVEVRGPVASTSRRHDSLTGFIDEYRPPKKLALPARPQTKRKAKQTKPPPDLRWRSIPPKIKPKHQQMPFIAHRCGRACLSPGEPDQPEGYLEHEYRNQNLLTIPLVFGWSRELRNNIDAKKIQRRKTAYEKNKDKESGVPELQCHDVTYVSPCGRSLTDITQVQDYLVKTRSDLAIDMFSYDVDTDISSGNQVRPCYYIRDDLSGGQEKQSISVINEEDEDQEEQFDYSALRTFSMDVFNNIVKSGDVFDPGFRSCCNCTDNCADASSCACQQLTADLTKVIPNHQVMRETGYLGRRLVEQLHTGIYECNDGCTCNRNCGNRLVQLGIRIRLQLFKTVWKGWGIRCLDDLPAGSFICSYAAEILTPEEGNNDDRDDMYFADMDTIDIQEQTKWDYQEAPEWDITDSDEEVSDEDDDDEYRGGTRSRPSSSKSKQPLREQKSKSNQSTDKLTKPKKQPIMVAVRKLLKNDENRIEDASYVLDAKFKGNVGRYFNHSCEPNCHVQNVFVDTHDLRFPWIGLFTLKPVKAMEELTWDYSYEVGSVEGRVLKCYCKTKKCRGRLL